MAEYREIDVVTEQEDKLHGKKGNVRPALILVVALAFLALVGAIVGISFFVIDHNAAHTRGGHSTASDYAPKQLFLAAGHNASTAVNISWVTDSADTLTCAQVGVTADVLNRKICGNKTGYTFNSYKFGLYHSPTLHRVTVDGLSPDTTYFYSVGDASHASTVRSFRTAPAPFKATAFTVIGDMGQTENSALTLAQMETFDASAAMLHVGDMSYADTKQTRWKSWFNLVSPLSSRLQWMVLPGNHEIESQTGTGLSFAPYQALFHMPAAAPPVNIPVPAQADCQWWAPGEPWAQNHPGCCASVLVNNTYDYGNAFYSFDVASVHVISLNSYTDLSKSSVQYKWVERDLQLTAQRPDHPWVIVMMHCPFYNSNTHHQNEPQTLAMKSAMEELFLRYGVDLVLAGHVHAYERTHRIAYSKRDPKGIYYVTMGDGGNREGHAQPFEDPKPDWSAKRNDDLYGHARINVPNATHMHWQWFPTNAAGTNVAEDDKWITRDV